MLLEYAHLARYFLFCVLLVSGLAGLSMSLVYHNLDAEKTSAYECGFHPFQDARIPFEVRFYLVGVLFIIFDLEIAFLYPWVLVYSFLSSAGFYSMVLFLFLLALGLWYEWSYGALDL